MGLGKIKISNFLNKLYDLINDQKYSNDIHWSKDGDSFIIKNFDNFCYNIMPKIFNLKLFSSFHHQLNCYGFIKINQQEYYNKNFRKNNRQLLINIKRKKRKKLLGNNPNNVIKNIEMKINIMKNKRQQLENSLYLIQKKQEYLINENQFLKNKLFESQTKKKDLCYIFFSMVENLFPEFSFIKKQCLYFINSNSVSISNIENNSSENLNNYLLTKNNNNSYKIDSGISLCNTQDTKNGEDYDNFMDVE
jgi:hypothetical protein